MASINQNNNNNISNNNIDKMTKLFWLIYNSKETLWGDFKNPKFVTENAHIINYLVKSLHHQLSPNEIIQFIEQQWCRVNVFPACHQPSISNDSEMFKMINILKKENQNLKERLNHYEPVNLYCLNVDQLNSLSLKFNKQIEKIEQIIKEKYDRKSQCIICRDADKNIVIQDCGHFVLCADCEPKLPHKICPQCQRSYTNTFKVRL